MTENKDKKIKINTEENEKLKTQIDASIGIARSLINSWLPPPKPGEKLDDDQEDRTLANYSTGRPDRLGLGAKFLSHAEAMRHNNDNSLATKEELQLKNKILNQNRRAAAREVPTPIGKRYRPQDQHNTDSESDDEEGSRSTTVGNKPSKTKPKANAQPSSAKHVPANKNKIGNQGDFLSMYLTERAGKKKKNKK